MEHLNLWALQSHHHFKALNNHSKPDPYGYIIEVAFAGLLVVLVIAVVKTHCNTKIIIEKIVKINIFFKLDF